MFLLAHFFRHPCLAEQSTQLAILSLDISLYCKIFGVKWQRFTLFLLDCLPKGYTILPSQFGVILKGENCEIEKVLESDSSEREQLLRKEKLLWLIEKD